MSVDPVVVFDDVEGWLAGHVGTRLLSMEVGPWSGLLRVSTFEDDSASDSPWQVVVRCDGGDVAGIVGSAEFGVTTIGPITDTDGVGTSRLASLVGAILGSCSGGELGNPVARTESLSLPLRVPDPDRDRPRRYQTVTLRVTGGTP